MQLLGMWLKLMANYLQSYNINIMLAKSDTIIVASYQQFSLLLYTGSVPLMKVIATSTDVCLHHLNNTSIKLHGIDLVRICGQDHQISILPNLQAANFILPEELISWANGVGLEYFIN